MRPDDLRRHVRKQPFQPFRLFITDGSDYLIRHPEHAAVFQSYVWLGIPGTDALGQPIEREVEVALLHITRIEPQPPAPAASAN